MRLASIDLWSWWTRTICRLGFCVSAVFGRARTTLGITAALIGGVFSPRKFKLLVVGKRGWSAGKGGWSYGACLQPELAGSRASVDPEAGPPCRLVADPMDLSVMSAAERDHEFVAHLTAEGAELREPQVMGIGGLPPADEAGLRGHEAQMGFVAVTARFANGEHALVDSATDAIMVSVDGVDIAPGCFQLRLDANARRRSSR
jgi:hypothetical protein